MIVLQIFTVMHQALGYSKLRDARSDRRVRRGKSAIPLTDIFLDAF